MPARTQRALDARRRLLRLAAWIVRKGSATRAEIYEEFADAYTGDAAAREKKWSRDKRDLRQLGIPLAWEEHDRDGGLYVVDPTSATLPRLEFAPDEATALWTAGQAALRSEDHPLHDDLELALRKLALGTSGLPPRAAPLEVEGVRDQPRALLAWLSVLEDAVERRKCVKLRYRKPTGDVSERLVDPYGYAWRRGHWIFVGHCHLRGQVRLFFLDRTERLALAGGGSARGGDFSPPTDFDIRRWSRQEAWSFLVHGPREAAVRFGGSLARIAVQLLPEARFSRDGAARVARLEVTNLSALVRQALAWGPEAELLEPAEGRAMARAILDDLAARLLRPSPAVAKAVAEVSP